MRGARRLLAGVLPLAGVLACAAAAQAATSPTTCNYSKYGRQDPAFRVENLKVLGAVRVVWAPKNLAHGLPTKATPHLACTVAATLAAATTTFWGEQGANVPKIESPSGVGPKGHEGAYWTSTGWTSRMSGSVSKQRVHWLFRQSGAGSVSFDVNCSHKACKAV